MCLVFSTATPFDRAAKLAAGDNFLPKSTPNHYNPRRGLATDRDRQASRGVWMMMGYEVVMYTDGACSGNPGPGGWACILIHPATQTIKKIADGVPNTTNNRMELLAVINGLRTLKRRSRVQVFSDSEYVVRGMNEWLPGWIRNDWRRGKKPVKNADLWKTLAELRGKHEVAFEHVRGHAGHAANEECDRMAVAAINALKRKEAERELG